MPWRRAAFFVITALVAILATGVLSRNSTLAELHSARTFPEQDDILPNIFLPVQTRNVDKLTTGSLLVASRNLGDPHFAETVVLLVHYDAKEVVGLILNRRTDIPLSRALDGLKAAKGRSDPVYLGGPVGAPAVFALSRSATNIEGAEHVVAEVYLISAKDLFEQTISSRPDPKNFHVYVGYAGWTNEQLRMEVELGSWFIFPGDAASVFNSDPDSLWPTMIRKTELKLAGSDSPTLFPGASISLRFQL